MCLLVFSLRTNAEYPFIFAGNRDEFHSRPAEPARFWPDAPDLLAGRDLQAGGTWLGVTRTGRFATVTNYREPGERRPDARSRGELVVDYLKGSASAEEFLVSLQERAQEYSGFNLILGTPEALYYFSNRGADESGDASRLGTAGSIHLLDDGVYGLSNDQLDTPWPKVRRAKSLFHGAIGEHGANPEALLGVLTDPRRADDESLPSTGVSLEWERALSSIFIEGEEYGTRASTVITIDRNERVTFVERSTGPGGQSLGLERYQFQIVRSAFDMSNRGKASAPGRTSSGRGGHDGDVMMRAVVVDEPGGPEKLSIGFVPKPVPRDDELLVRVHATALNRADLMQREGRYPPPQGASPILGLEMAGTVEAAGRACPTWNAGDRVCGLLPGGGYAEYAVIHRDLAISIPPTLSFQEAAAIPEVFLTAFQALHWYGEIDRTKRVLIHAGASGVGTAAIQLARAAGARVYVTASARKHKTCLRLGARAAIDYESEDFATRIDELTGGAGVDVIVDFIGAPYFKQNASALALDGRWILLATLGGSLVAEVDLRDLFRKRASFFATTLRSRNLDYKIRLTQDFAGRSMSLFGDGTLKAVVDRVFDWTQVADAHQYMAENRNQGKIVLRVGT